MEHNYVLSVSELTQQIVEQLDQPMFKNMAVEGEISNFKHHSSGHMYFTLKDENSRVKAVMFRGKNQYLEFVPKNGDTVIALGSLGVYAPNGEYQIYIDRMFPQGLGLLHIRFEELKARLDKEGLFAAERKKILPFLPRRIAVVTSPTGAAVRDILSVIHRRHPRMDVVIIPAIVQGEAGPESIVKALKAIEYLEDVDVVILARGGGSMEELWAFNDEAVARAIADCPLPVVTGVGHETDFTIADFVADHRAPTPSAAAELVCPDYRSLRHTISDYTYRLQNCVIKRLAENRRRLDLLSNSAALRRPLDRINQERQRVDELVSRAGLNIYHRRRCLHQALQILTGKLDSLSPLATLSRGYAVCQKLDGELVRDYSQVVPGDAVRVRLHKGSLYCTVEKGEEEVGQVRGSK